MTRRSTAWLAPMYFAALLPTFIFVPRSPAFLRPLAVAAVIAAVALFFKPSAPKAAGRGALLWMLGMLAAAFSVAIPLLCNRWIVLAAVPVWLGAISMFVIVWQQKMAEHKLES